MMTNPSNTMLCCPIAKPEICTPALNSVDTLPPPPPQPGFTTLHSSSRSREKSPGSEAQTWVEDDHSEDTGQFEEVR